MVVLRVHRRAASVPVGEPPVSEDTHFATQNSLLFSRAAIDNTDALSTASKRNDQQFLRDVNSLIGNSSSNQPYVKAIKKTHHGHPSAYPLTNRRRSIAVSSVLRPPLPLVDDNSTDADVDYEVKLLAPITNRISKYGRATSVPPQSVALTSHHPILTSHSVLYNDGLGYDHYVHRPILVAADYHHHHHPTPSIYELHQQSHQPVVTHHDHHHDHHHHQKLNPVADLAVRQAHRNLDRIEAELKSSGDDVVSHSPRTLVYRNYRDGPGLVRRSSSYHGPRSSTVRTRSPSPVSTVTPVRRTVRSTYSPVLQRDAELYEYLPTSTLKRNIETDLLLASTELNAHPTHAYHTKTDLPLSYYLPPSSSYTTYSSLPSSVKRSVEWNAGPVDKLILPNLYHNGPGSYVLPSGVVRKVVSSGSHPSSVVFHSASPDSHSLTLHSLTPHTVYTTPSSYTSFSHAPQKPPIVPKRAASVPAAQPSPPGFQNVVRPKVSDTRRKVRDVLCKVKGDPHYFDD